jgi:Fur family transcriptional regulator, ferric uptake regulator
MASRLEQICIERGLKMTEQRRTICRVLSDSSDHPDVEMVYRRSVTIDPKISIATVYRTMRLLEESNVIRKHEFGDGRARFEESSDDHHDHLMDVKTGEVIEFTNDAIERLQEEVAKQLGYELIGHKLELYGVKIKDKK